MTFWPVIISSMKPLTRARLSCWVRKYLRLRLPSQVVVTIMTAAITMLTMVRGTLSTTIEAKVTPMVMTELNTWEMLVLIIWRSESTSLV